MPLETTTMLTYDEYKKFNYAVLHKTLGFKMKILYIASAVLIIINVILIFSQGFIDSYNIAMFAFVFIWLFLLYFIPNRQIKKTYNTTKIIQNYNSIMTFYDDYYTEKSDFNFTQIKYDELHKIIETNTHFYLLVGEIGGSIVIKENCSAQLIEFLQKIKIEFKK